MRVLGISGSLRRESHNTRLLRAAAELLPPPVEFELFEGLKGVPPYDEDDDGDLAPEGARLREAIAAADARADCDPRVQLTRSRASSRTRWTGRHARFSRTSFATSRWP